MDCYVRFLAHSTLWADLSDDSLIDASIPIGLLTDVWTPKGGTSYWKIDFTGPDSLARVVAAYASSQSALNGVCVGILPVEEAEKAGVKAKKKSSSGSADKEFGKSFHYEFDIVTIEQAFALIDVIRRRIETVPLDQVKRHLFSSIENGSITIDDLNDKLVGYLFKRGYLKPA